MPVSDRIADLVQALAQRRGASMWMVLLRAVYPYPERYVTHSFAANSMHADEAT